MLKKNETREVIFEHPKGYFQVIERCGQGILGGEYCIRETVYPRQKQQKNAVPCPKTRKVTPQPHLTRKKQDFFITEQEKIRFAELYQKGYTFRQIAAISDRSKTAIADYLCKMGIYRRRTHAMVESRKAQMKELAQKGITNKEIAEIMGVSKTTISQHLRAMGIYRKKPIQTY